MALIAPALFGLKNSNHDFSKRDNWGKNIFNNAFPASLTCYMFSTGIEPVYYRLDETLQIKQTYIAVDEFFGIAPDNPDIFFSFEADFAPYRSLIEGTLPRADLVISTRSQGYALTPIEIKLTALPDSTTYKLSEDMYGCEIVVRPDTIIYMALSIVAEFVSRRDELEKYMSALPRIDDWADTSSMLSHIPAIADVLDNLMKNNLHIQRPLIMQPIWKTRGKQLSLHQDAFDVFIWSDFAFTRLFFRDATNYIDSNRKKITRGARSIIWLAKMLKDFADNGKIEAQTIIDTLTFSTKNDKAFAVSGKVTQALMACEELTKPRVKRGEIRNIILGGGENFLSPERRLDAAIAATPELFED